MNSFARIVALGTFVVISGLSLTDAGVAQDAMATPMASDAMSAAPMATTPMAGDAMTADPMAANAAMEECHIKANAETDVTEQTEMMAACDAMGAHPVGGDAMSPMAPDAMATPVTK
jgi:pentapeptide MXKDX repeat protein